MNRIIKKILIIAICLVCLAFAAFAAAETAAFSQALKKITDDKLCNETGQLANRLSMIFENAEGSVDSLCADVKNEFNVTKQMQDRSYIDKYMAEHSPIVRDALIDIEDAQGLFLTFAPELTDKKKAYEIWYSYDENGRIVDTDATTNGIYYEAFDDEDMPTMKYYFNAIENGGGGVWIEPWLDTDIDKELITYSRAIYSGDTLIGVLGTDIYTEYTIDFISHMKVDYDGMIFLLNHDNEQIISSGNVKDTGILDADAFWDTMTQNMEGKHNGIFNADWNGQPMRISFSELSNEWKLATIYYENNIYHSYRNILFIVIALSVILIVLLTAAMFFAVRYFSSPVDKAIKLLKLMDLENHVGEEEAAEIRGEDDMVSIVRNAMKRQRMNDIMLANQSRFAAVGEMMANVTHQWKQPLNNINIVMGTLKDDIENGDMNEEDALLAVQKVERLTTGMSETLNDFSDYLKPDTEVVEFHVKEVVSAALDLLKDKLKTKHIGVSLRGDDTLVSHGYKNALYHAVLNVANNAIDAIDEKYEGDSSGRIDINIGRLQDAEHKIAIEIFNNGVPLSQRAQENLFKPYYTTKGSKDGTGLGLAISKSFIEEGMDGKITLENYEDGVKCTIIINGGETRYDR